MKRRTYLSALGVGAAALAGCTGKAERSDGNGDGDGITLTEIHAENTDTVGHTIRVLVEFDGELVHWSATEVAGFDSFAGEPGDVELERTWPDEAGRVTVHARLDDEEDWTRENLGETIKGSCAAVHLSVGRDGELTIMFSGGCGTPTQTETASS